MRALWRELRRAWALGDPLPLFLVALAAAALVTSAAVLVKAVAVLRGAPC